MGDGPDYREALLADIQLRQVEPEDLGLADQIPSPFGDANSTILQQAIADRRQVVEELGHARISGRESWLLEGQPQALDMNSSLRRYTSFGSTSL